MKQAFLMLCLCACTAFTAKAQPFLVLHNHFPCDDLVFVVYAENATCGAGTYVSNPITIIPGDIWVYDFSGGPVLPGFWAVPPPASATLEFVRAEVSITAPASGFCSGFPYDLVSVDNPVCGNPMADFVLSTTAGGSTCASCPSASPTVVNVQFNVPATVTTGDWEVLAR